MRLPRAQVRGKLRSMAPPKKNYELTTMEKDVLDYYRAHSVRGNGPSTRSVALALGCYPNSISHALRRLEEKGYLEKKPVMMLRLRLTKKAERTASPSPREVKSQAEQK